MKFIFFLGFFTIFLFFTFYLDALFLLSKSTPKEFCFYSSSEEIEFWDGCEMSEKTDPLGDEDSEIWYPN